MSHIHCELSASASHLDELSSGDDERPHSQMEVWNSPSQSGTPRLKRRLQGSGHQMSPHFLKKRLAQQALQQELQSSQRSLSESIAMSVKKSADVIQKATPSLSQLNKTPEPDVVSLKTKITWHNFHRWVEQRADEPLGMILLKWFLMIAGFVMVIAALGIMFKVIHQGATKANNSSAFGDQTIGDDLFGAATTIQADTF